MNTEELKDYCEKQYVQIEQLLEKNLQCEEEIKRLKTIAEQSLLVTSKVSSEELICLKQINDLRNASEISTLTYEEAKKLELYVKTLRLIRNKDKDSEDLPKGTSTEDLLKLVENEFANK